MTPIARTRADMCPGALRPWAADDGLLVRLRLVGGRLPIPSLARLLQLSQRFSDGAIHLTKRANLEVRGLPDHDGQLPADVLSAIEATGLLPSRTHELVRNILVSPQTGVAGGLVDLRSVATSLDAALRGDADLARLPGRFLFTLDDGRGDLLYRLTGSGRQGTDLGLIAVSAEHVQLRVGDHWGEVVRLDEAALHLAGLAAAFLTERGSGASAPWHLRELAAPLRTPKASDPRIPAAAPPLPYGSVAGGTHEEVPDGVLTAAHARALLAHDTGDHAEVVVTPWHGIFVPRQPEAPR